MKLIKYKTFIVLNVFLPILLGLIIYILWRPTTLYVFNWFKVLKNNNFINNFRNLLEHPAKFIPDWIIFSLPNALWIYSFTITLLLIWFDANNFIKYFFIFIPIALGIGSELAQLIGIIPGVFCVVDLYFYIIAYASSFLVFKMYVSLNTVVKRNQF